MSRRDCATGSALVHLLALIVLLGTLTTWAVHRGRACAAETVRARAHARCREAAIGGIDYALHCLRRDAGWRRAVWTLGGCEVAAEVVAGRREVHVRARCWPHGQRGLPVQVSRRAPLE
ncbi:MAG: hypothetical protein H6837_19630 [Planctomycetes bacterium]|nr:hypothetical protein [Planctomycetota bacterium]